MLKQWMGVAVLLAVLLLPGLANAQELPPENIGIPVINEAAAAPVAQWEPGIPVPLDEYPTGSWPVPEEPAAPPALEVPAPETLPAPSEPRAPAVTEILLAEFSTPLINSPANRNHNIKQALDAINEQTIKPGAAWSFNETVGPRTAERGYKEAMIIVNKKFVPGLGGGICQVASTLYNAVLQAQFKVLERHPHSLPVNYVAPGRDATISYGIQDFKFMNSLEQEVIMRARMEAGKIIIAFFIRQPGTDNLEKGL